jgi:hypothetical protein
LSVIATRQAMPIKHDKKEDDPKFQAQIKAAEEEAAAVCIAINGKMGYCHVFWEKKRQILKEKYDIKWKSHAELNRGIKFD